jgi:hypothetical protein
MISFLKILVMFSMLFSLAGLIFLLVKTFSFGQNKIYAKSRGSEKKGILYAFSTGMMPWAKESARKHLPTYLTGVIYHIGIFLAFLIVVLKLVSISVPDLIIPFLRTCLAASLIGGVGLFIKRLLKPEMKIISCPDDYAANIIVNTFLASALALTYFESLISLFFFISITMFVYIPLGKIRHCFFFIYTRILFGRFFGRRGIFPRRSHQI